MRRQLLLAVLLALFIATSASAGSNAFAPGQLVPTYDTPPQITGRALQGQTFTASADTKNGPAPTYSFQWVRCSSSGTACAAIDKATLQTYLLTATDVGDTIRVAVTATNKNGSTIATSDASPVVTTNTASTGTTTTTTTTSSTTPTTTTTTTATTTTTTTPTTTSSPPPSGTILERKTWEEGILDSTGWTHQCQDNLGAFTGAIARGTVTIDGGTFDTGAKSGRFDVPASSGGQACQMMTAPFRNVSAEQDDYYSFAFRTPTSGYAPPTFVNENIYDLNYYGLNSAPIHVAINWNGGILLVLNTGYCTPDAGCGNYSGQDCCSGFKPRGLLSDGPYWLVPANAYSPGTWYEAVVHIYNTVTNNGVVEAWSRPRGGSWTKRVDKHGGFPTLQWGYSINAQRWYTQDQIAGLSSVDKWGIYRSGAVSYPATVWNDNFCRATTFDAAVSCST